MKKNNLVKLLGIALVVAIISTGLFYGLFVNKLSSKTGTGNTMVVAAKPIKAGVVLQPSDLKTIPWPTQDLPKGTFATPDSVAGHSAFDIIGDGEPIVESRLVTKDSVGGIRIPNGMRAVSVHVTDSTGVMSLLRPGHKIDVQVVNGKGSEISVRTVLESLTVLTVNPQTEQSSQGSTLPVVTLIASPYEADVLATADAGARVRLTLRNPLDENTRSRSPMTLDGVMRTSGSSSPARTASVAVGKPAGRP